MLNYPEHGWCEVAIGTFKERASYLTDLPLNILETVIHTLKTGKPAVCECDAEGYDYLIVFTQDNVEIILNKEKTKLFSFDTDIKTVSREILNDIQPKIQLWTDWLEDSDEFENRQKNERKLTELCTEVENLLNGKRENIKNTKDTVEFVSYTGKYPNLCSGILTLRINGVTCVFPRYCMCSGGSVWFDGLCNEHVETGLWTITDIPDEYKYLKNEIEECVNANIPHGCCGGCV